MPEAEHDLHAMLPEKGPPPRRAAPGRWILIIAMAAATCSVAIVLLSGRSSKPASGPGWRSGVFAGYGPSGLAAFAQWRGASVRSATDYPAEDDWGQIENPAWTISQWSADHAVVPDLSIAPWPSEGGSLQQAASGAYNLHFADLARNLIAGGLGHADIRLGWEFNGTWYRWSVHSPYEATLFAMAWRQLVESMRSVPGAHFTFDWCPNLQTNGIDPALAYPGDRFVSEIGLDVYDWSETGPGETAAQRWRDIVGKGYGLAWQQRFAAIHHKPISFPEWGLVSDPTNPALAGGDDPLFVQNMFAWFKAHNVAFENYFDANAPTQGRYYAFSSGLFPRASQRYRELYSAK